VAEHGASHLPVDPAGDFACQVDDFSTGVFSIGNGARYQGLTLGIFPAGLNGMIKARLLI
jgi:hypothetical protein